MKHCWHYTGEALMSNPVIRIVVCCHCGVGGRVYAKFGDIPGHGPNLPKEEKITYDISEAQPMKFKLGTAHPGLQLQLECTGDKINPEGV